jgi:hypothetical protein
LELYADLQENLNIFLKKYDDTSVLNTDPEIIKLEIENKDLYQKIEALISTRDDIQSIQNVSDENTNVDYMNTFVGNETIEDPFQAFDPFKNSNCESFNKNNISPIKTFIDDPFQSSFDPFNINSNTNEFGNMDKKSIPPARPAPPRANTPSLKPVKKSDELGNRPQSAMDFTHNKQLELFNNANDPFNSTNNKGLIYIIIVLKF